ncbi:phage integrase N-terminal SAM-like domain-containing protein [uncultured Lacinutrix sp.]|uniref:tyrosine-type recombinase/integrase n=1 Tax=uncultured Lacinutrix sp. TaxID=574032 RepID=UPI002618F844|nr:phage integrase N-terminal SAM-like domain-containing protein [uncultured Lacinutrix sp.]
MKHYDQYLREQDYAKTTINSYLIAKSRFIEWCDSKGYEAETIDYKSCLEYAKKLQRTRNGKMPSKSTVRHQIGALKIYFNYLVDENYRGDNPMESMNIRGVKRTLNHNLLEFEELEDLFYSYPTRNIELPSSPHVAMRDKVITGMMVYQGLNATALKTLKVEHINLERGKIYVPSTRKTNSRELEIKSPQILSLAEYINVSREAIQNSIGCHSEAFIPQNSDRFAVTYWLFKKLRRINHNVKDTKQIRASVITYWLQYHNIREVQYMAGHRYISSTERYVQDDLESLQEVIDTLHPIS